MSRRCLICSNVNPCAVHGVEEQTRELERNLRAINKLQDVEKKAQRKLIEKAKKMSWRCFHCDEKFTDRIEAERHFGKYQDCTPACQVGVELFRKMEAELESYRTESDATSREFYGLGAKHAGELRRAEEEGYEKGLKDGRALLPDDLFSHYVSWRGAIVECIMRAPAPGPDHDDQGYWKHELEVFDRVFGELGVRQVEKVPLADVGITPVNEPPAILHLTVAEAREQGFSEAEIKAAAEIQYLATPYVPVPIYFEGADRLEYILNDGARFYRWVDETLETIHAMDDKNTLIGVAIKAPKRAFKAMPYEPDLAEAVAWLRSLKQEGGDCGGDVMGTYGHNSRINRLILAIDGML